MGRFVLRRLVQAVPTLFGILLLTFLLTRLSPSDPVALMFGDRFNVTEEQRQELRHNLGLDEPLPIQFITYLGKVVVLDFGNSFIYHRPVMQVIAERLPNSLQLSIAALLVGLAIGVPLGILAALTRGRLPDHVIRLTSVVGQAIPTFWFGILTLLIGGAVITEQIFNWPGLGRLFFEALVNKDFPIVQANVVVGSALLLLSYILRDVVYVLVDPRIKVKA